LLVSCLRSGNRFSFAGNRRIPSQMLVRRLLLGLSSAHQVILCLYWNSMNRDFGQSGDQSLRRRNHV